MVGKGQKAAGQHQVILDTLVVCRFNLKGCGRAAAVGGDAAGGCDG